MENLLLVHISITTPIIKSNLPCNNMIQKNMNKFDSNGSIFVYFILFSGIWKKTCKYVNTFYLMHFKNVRKKYIKIKFRLEDEGRKLYAGFEHLPAIVQLLRTTSGPGTRFSSLFPRRWNQKEYTDCIKPRTDLFLFLRY